MTITRPNFQFTAVAQLAWPEATSIIDVGANKGQTRQHVIPCTALYCTVLYCTVLYCTVLYCTVLYCTVLYCTVLYCTVLYCTVLYCCSSLSLDCRASRMHAFKTTRYVNFTVHGRLSFSLPLSQRAILYVIIIHRVFRPPDC